MNDGLGSKYNVSISDIEEFLSVHDDIVKNRSRGIMLQVVLVEFDTIGKWILACLSIRRNNSRKLVNQRLRYEILVQFSIESEEIRFNDLF